MMEHRIVISRSRSGLGHNNAAAAIKKAARRALDCEGVGKPCYISVLLTDDEGIRALNRDFRGKDAATDVLSFPMNELTPGRFDAEQCETDPDSGLTVHSVLHLLGYDHVDEGEMKKKMRAREKVIMGDKD